MDQVQADAIPSSNEESPAQKQARIRRERREAKIKAGGSARLEKITNLSGRPVESAQPPRAAFQSPAVNDDPDEVDISDHPFTSSRASPSPLYGQTSGPTEQELRQLLRSGGSPPSLPENPFLMPGQGPNNGAMGGGNEDPMMRMLQQMMGGIHGGPGGPGGAGGGGGVPPELAAMLGGGAPGPQMQLKSNNGYLWKILHGIFALSLGLYVLSSYHFNGSRVARQPYVSSGESQTNIFWIFTTVELVLQSTRFFLERGKVGQPGILGTVANFLPMPWKGYLSLVARYSGIYTTIVEDAMVVVFMVGCVAWWQGGVA